MPDYFPTPLLATRCAPPPCLPARRGTVFRRTALAAFGIVLLSAQCRGDEPPSGNVPRAVSAEDSPVVAAGFVSQPKAPVETPAAADGKTAAESKATGTPAKRTPPSRAATTPLSKPGGGNDKGDAHSKPSGDGLSITSILAALGVVLGLFFAVAWLMRRGTPGNYGLLPSEVVEVLGRLPLAARQQVHLIRVGSKLVLICATPAGVEALTEVTDPDEVARLAGLCRQTQPNSSTALFRQFFQQFTREHENLESPRGAKGRRGKEASMGGRPDGD
jgi:flagellar biogenesis protein FliO